MLGQRALAFIGGCFLFLGCPPLGAQTDAQAEAAQRGRELMGVGQFEQAIPVYARLVNEIPGNPGLLLNLGLAQHMSGRNHEAVATLKSVLKLDPSLLPAQLFLGASYLDSGQPALAVAPLRKVVEAQPGDPKARQLLADALFSTEKYEEAARHFRKLSEIDPGNARGWNGLGRSYESISRQAFDALSKAAPDSPYLLSLVGATRLKQQQYRTAFYFYRQALAKAPNLRGLHNAMAEIYRNTGHPDWAATEQEREKSLPKPDCAQNKAECEFVAGRFDQVLRLTAPVKTAAAQYWRIHAANELAAGAFERLAQLPPSAEIHELMAETHRSRGKHLEAVKEWREALKLSPGSPRLERELAISLYQAQDFKTALPMLEQLLRADKQSPDLNFLVGDAHLNLQNAEQSIPFLKEAIRREPKMTAARAALGRALMQTGKPAEAIPHLQAALAIDDDGSLHYQLGRAYQSTGQRELAAQSLKEYKEITAAADKQKAEIEAGVQISPP